MKSYDVVIIGAGAAGLMCAATAARRGRRVLVIELANKPGKKILMSGGGRCNFTNLYTEPEHFISENPHFCKSALARYTPWNFVELVERYGIGYHEKTKGQLFCNEKSQCILDLLINECQAGKVDIICRARVDKIESKDDDFRIKASAGSFQCESLVVATGGLSIPTMGATGFGYEVAKQFGHSIVQTKPGLVPFTISSDLKSLCERCSGISVEISVECSEMRFDGPLLFTHRGLSGPAMLQISNYWQPGDSLRIQLVPNNIDNNWFDNVVSQSGNSTLRIVLANHLPKRVADEICDYWNWPAGSIACHLTAQERAKIQQVLTAWILKPSNTEGYRTAEVTLGGVNTRELSSKSLMSSLQSGLFFIGEVVDVTGWLGGFNFQWAWASAVAAGNEC